MGGAELLDQIEPLWLALREHHAALSPIWRKGLLQATFEARRAELLAKSTHGMLVIVAGNADDPAGYCVSTIDDSGEGEIDSLFVACAYRRRGIGRALVIQSMNWLRAQGVGSIVVEVMAGNDEAARLYEQFGFKTRTLRMRHV